MHALTKTEKLLLDTCIEKGDIAKSYGRFYGLAELIDDSGIDFLNMPIADFLKPSRNHKITFRANEERHEKLYLKLSSRDSK
jgi:hypothetical protein